MSGVLSLMGFALVEVEERAAEALQKFEESTAMVQEASSLSEEVKSQNRLGHLFNASRAYLAMGDLKQAQTYADEYGTRVDAGRNPGQIKAAHQLFGLIAASRGQFNTAIKEFRLGNLQSPYVLFHLARAYEGAGNEASARKYYEEVANFNGLNSSPAAAVRVRAVKKAAAM